MSRVQSSTFKIQIELNVEGGSLNLERSLPVLNNWANENPGTARDP